MLNYKYNIHQRGCGTILSCIIFATLSLTESYFGLFTQRFKLTLEIRDKDINTDDTIALINFHLNAMPDVNGSPQFDSLKDGSAT